jgi:peptidoglycan/xylan/chitin deacetylase (PgdA/CDA1 family)
VKVQLALLSLAAATCLAAAGPKISVARWPGDRVAAASLTFDDGMRTHLDIAGPILKKHHLTGTFFVTTGSEAWRLRLDGWRQLAADGNEIADHTVRHPCLLDRITPHSQDYTPAMMEAEVRDAAREITEKIGGRRGITFGYPCGSLSFGKPADHVSNSVLYQQYVASCCFAARAYTGIGAQDPDALNVLNVIDLGRTAERGSLDLLAMLAPAVRDHAWGIYTFHGVGGEYLSVTADALDELAGFLERHPEIWTATFGDGIRYTQERRSLGIETVRADDHIMEAALTWPLDPQIFDLPLTLKVELPEDWKAAQAEGEALLASKMVPGEKGMILLIDVPPRTRSIRISRR